MASKDAVTLLGKVPLFAGCSKRELREIARAAKEIRHREGRVIARQGDTGVGFFLITDGTAEVAVRGRRRRKLKPGDFFGEIALLDRGPRTATVTATSPITLLGLTAWAFKSLVERHPTIALNMLKAIAGRVRAETRVDT